jgi:hypothetical protein
VQHIKDTRELVVDLFVPVHVRDEREREREKREI